MDDLRYPALKTIASFYRILAFITLVFTFVFIIIGVLATFITGNFIGGGLLGFLGSLLGAVFGSIVIIFMYGLAGAVVGVLQLAVAEVLQVIMDIEANTRK
jgi:hypothetical protein